MIGNVTVYEEFGDPEYPLSRAVNEAISQVKRLCEYAYEEGYHELGQDPVQILVEEIKKLRKLQGQTRMLVDTIICSKCNGLPASHAITRQGESSYLCCPCYVREGFPPADYHPLCLAEYDIMRKEKCKRTFQHTPDFKKFEEPRLE